MSGTATTTTSRAAAVVFRSGRLAERRSRASGSKSGAASFGPLERTAGSRARTRSGRSANREVSTLVREREGAALGDAKWDVGDLGSGFRPVGLGALSD